jgi:hypothetical protein
VANATGAVDLLDLLKNSTGGDSSIDKKKRRHIGVPSWRSGKVNKGQPLVISQSITRANGSSSDTILAVPLV